MNDNTTSDADKLLPFTASTRPLSQNFTALAARPVDPAVEARRRSSRADVIFAMASLTADQLARLAAFAAELTAE